MTGETPNVHSDYIYIGRNVQDLKELLRTTNSTSPLYEHEKRCRTWTIIFRKIKQKLNIKYFKEERGHWTIINIAEQCS